MKKIISLLLLISWCLVIFFFSSQSAQDSTSTSSFVASLLPFLPLFWVRKLAHFFEFFVLGVLAINWFSKISLNSKKVIMISCIFCLLYAFSDEVHQMFIDGRAPRLLDVLIDFGGALIGIKIYSIIKNK